MTSRAITGAAICILGGLIARQTPVAHADGAFAVFTDMISQLVGTDAEDAQELTRATVAATRSTHALGENDQAIAFGGAIGTVAQGIDQTRSLHLAWHGGQFPFHATITAVAGAGWQREVTADTRVAIFDLRGATPGAYRLVIDAANDRHLALRLNLLQPSAIPTVPASAAATTAEQNELLQAVWLLMRAGTKWHMEALSRLQVLADVDHEPVAKQILAPPP